ncbi:uncharacterized protein LOC121614161 [Chelmon rostratus]|uniref:uncharacterized protein LOC121614161 n=1 Tax=Chelmon rostratus TaxID=109905 RepID=UPI001BE7FDBB|nr:uncharacterized protein LOC121614161 [Chelmon rostratus]
MNPDEQCADSTNQPKSRPGPEFLGPYRCAACYNHKASSVSWRGGSGESSSSAEDSGPEVDTESEAESSSSSSSSGKGETEKVSPVSGDAAAPESGGKDGVRPEEAGGTSDSQEDECRTQGVLSQKHDFHIIKKHLSETEEEKTEESTGGGREGVNNLLPPQMGLPWQPSQPTLQQHQLPHQHQQQLHQLSYQHQQQAHLCPPLSAQGQRLPPPPHTLPVFYPPTLHTPQRHLHALGPQPCWYCNSMDFPYSPY